MFSDSNVGYMERECGCRRRQHNRNSKKQPKRIGNFMGCASSHEQQVVSRPLKPVKAFKPIPDRYETLGRNSMAIS